MFLCSQPEGRGPVPAVVELEVPRAPPPAAVEAAEAAPPAEAAATAAPPAVAVPVDVGPGVEILEGEASPSTPNISSASARFECLTLSAAVLFA